MDDATQSLCRKYRGKVAEYLVAMQDKEDDAVDTKEHPSSSESTLFTAFFSYFNQALILLIQERGKAFQYKKISMVIRPSSSLLIIVILNVFMHATICILYVSIQHVFHYIF